MRIWAAALFALLAATAPADNKIRVEINGKPVEFKAAPVIRGAEVWVPVGETTKALGGKIQVIERNKLLGICLGNKCIPLRIGRAGGGMMVKGTAMAPAAKMAEALEARERWDKRNKVLQFFVSRRLPAKRGE